MLIGIDGNEANVEKRVGISEYAFELLWQFKKYQISIRQLADKYQIYLKEPPRKDLPQESQQWNYRVIGPDKLWTQFALPLDLYIHRPRPDVFFSPTHYAPRFSPIPTAISIMDLSYIHYPEMFRRSDLYQLRNWTAYSVRNAKKIFTISQASKNDIINYYKVSEGKVVVTYPGVKIKNTMGNSKLLTDKYGIGADYILFVGTLQPRKNIVRLVEAFSLLIRGIHPRGVPQAQHHLGGGKVVGSPHVISLVIVGKKGWKYEEILEAPKKYNTEKDVKFLDFIPDEELPMFYKHALCFVLPSLYEGFGLPILEAMQYGCPVITSSTSSLPEAGGDAAVYVDPQSIDDIVKKIVQVITNDTLRQSMIEKGYEQVKKFSWEKTARETLEVLRQVAEQK